MTNNKLTYYFEQFLEGFKAEITEVVATSVINNLKESNESLEGRPQNDVYLTIDEAASLFRISKSQINKMRQQHSNFPITKIGTAVRFKRTELELFFKETFNN
mgnify:CR=1 FL=1